MTADSDNAQKEKRKRIITVSAVLILLVFTVTAVTVAISQRNSGSDVSGVTDESAAAWGDSPLTKGIPEFSGGEPAGLSIAEDHVAAYYSSVGSDEIEKYVEKLKDEPGLVFGGTGFPRSAVYGDLTVALHYNVTERNFSVTVVKNTEENGDGVSQ